MADGNVRSGTAATGRASVPASLDAAYRLTDCLARREGRVFLTGTEALVRILLDQRRLDRRDGRKTAGFVSGYRGSPLGGLDLALWKAKDFLDAEDILFQPAVNEELAATAVMGTQQVESDPRRTVDGVFALWYGKGPGADRAGDALKHGTAYGSSPTGGVLVVVGDDHGCVSSSMSHQSDLAMRSWYMPVIHPADVGEYRDFGLWGIAASRFSGAWIGFKAISETVESGGTVDLGPLPHFRVPADYTPPEGGLHYRWPDFPGMQIERRNREKLRALAAFARANPLDRRVLGEDDARFGIVAAGKAYLDLMATLDGLGIDAARAAGIGLAVFKVGLVWPLESTAMLAFARGKAELLVVEEKRGLIEDQLKALLHDHVGAGAPRVYGKRGPGGEPWVEDVEELRPSRLRKSLLAWLGRIAPAREPVVAADQVDEVTPPGGSRRVPYFCSGCPHNRSTRVPEGADAFAGIGCHFMASWMDRQTTTLIQMGGEGVHWVGRAPFVGNRHAFQNLGDGTYFHSGQVALRQAVAAGINMTYKILYNDAVAMTGGQPVDGTLTVDQIARQVRAEGVERIAVLSDEPEKYHRQADFPDGTTIHHRDELLAVEKELQQVPGVSVLIYDQACAAEKRRKRKRGLYPDPPKRVFINERVCEGCGDCSVQSNCLSVVPVETAFGRKRRIEQSSCNKDYSCVDGFCPSFVTVEGDGLELKRPAPERIDADLRARLPGLPAPAPLFPEGDADILVTGVGGTGVVTIGRVVSMAAHLAGRSASVLDFMGFAQKGGAVLSHVRLRSDRSARHPVRIDRGETDILLACDIVVATDAEPLASLARGESRVIVNRALIPTADYVRDLRADIDYAGRLKALKDRGGA
ncbi:MAG: indolepyruvate ferredoxin oxidoreductase family protein, partial [Rhodothalassiaceae bacterium]